MEYKHLIGDLMKREKVTTKELAERMGCSVPNASRIRQKEGITLKTAIKAIQCLGYKIVIVKEDVGIIVEDETSI